MINTWNTAQLQQSFQQLNLLILNNKEYLNALDGVVGDGDHGSTVSTGFNAIALALNGTTFKDLGNCFHTAATAFIESTGGAIGPILGAFFAEGADLWEGLEEASGPEWSDLLTRGTVAVQAVGEANPGDKTLLDALLPACTAFARALEKGKTLSSCFQAGYEAACEGAQSTEKMTAKRGRARFAGQRSLGSRDAGAETITLIFKTWYELSEGMTPMSSPKSPGSQCPKPRPCSKSTKFINSPEKMIEEELAGFALAYPRQIELEFPGIITRAISKEQGKVALCIGHGGGHTPSMGGFVGPGLLDAAVVGSLFTCAAGTRIATALHTIDRGSGVVLLISSHEGDQLNARLALHLTKNSSLRVSPVLHYDDISTAPPDMRSSRRGLGGLLFAVATGGAAAEAGLTLNEVVQIIEKTRDYTVTLSVAANPPTHPATGEPLFQLDPGAMEVGMGVHGELGGYRGRLLSADQTIELITSKLLEDLPFKVGDETLIFLNGSGGISLMELHILNRGLHHFLTEKGIKIHDTVIGEYFTTFEMGGFSLSLCKVDAELKHWWGQPSWGSYFKK